MQMEDNGFFMELSTPFSAIFVVDHQSTVKLPVREVKVVGLE